MTILITGGAGFIGSNFVSEWLECSAEKIINLDKLTYAGNTANFEEYKNNSQHTFIKADIGDSEVIGDLLNKYKPRAVLNFAAESHVDRSINGPAAFIETNIVGTFHLLETVKKFWEDLSEGKKDEFRFLHVSTDEVYGSLEADDPAFSELNRYEPNSPYSASKASSDHLVRTYHHTYGLPVLTTNCSNNYGPFQFPEKLIPLIMHKALQGKALPIYGDGQQIRDWLYVTDHCSAIRTVLSLGKPGEVYNIGGLNEKTNVEIVHILCDLLDEFSPPSENLGINSYRDLITFVKDRPGHDRRYAIDARKIETELQWYPVETFETGIRKTVSWYLNHQNWVENIISGEYLKWVEAQYK